MEPSDEVLVLACRGGDAAAWEELVGRYQRLVYSIPRRAGLDEDAAADVFQRVFATLVEKIEQIEQPERINAWLVTTARRETWRTARRNRYDLPLAVDDGEDAGYDPPDTALLPDETLIRLEAQHTVRLALAELDERCRNLLNLLFYQVTPPPYAEIAAAVGVPAGSIGPTRARCLQKLRRLLDSAGF